MATAHSSAASFTDTTYAISAVLPATYDAAGYAASTITYTIIGKVSDFPTYGSTRSESTFNPINGPVEKVFGTSNFGGGDLIMADIPADVGQVILKAAELTPNTHFSLKITLPDSETHYLDVSIGGWALSAAKEGSVMTRTAKMAIHKRPVVVAAA